MIKILLILYLCLNAYSSEHIPFGIKDICNPMERTENFAACFDEKNLKWISYTIKTSEYEFRNNIAFSNSETIFEASGLTPYSLFPQPYKSNSFNLGFLSNEKNIKLIEELKRNTVQILKDNKVDKVNIIEGLLYDDKNLVKFQIDKKEYLIPKGYYIFITSIDERKILSLKLIDFNNSLIEESNLASINSLTNINFLFKLRN